MRLSDLSYSLAMASAKEGEGSSFFTSPLFFSCSRRALQQKIVLTYPEDRVDIVQIRAKE